MKKIVFIALFVFALKVNAQEPKEVINNKIVAASCGQCKFDMKGGGCDLAVKINGKSYFVDGSKIDDHGDAHAKDGFCATIRQAEVSGTIVNNRFVATSFKLLPNKKNTKKN